MEKLKTHPNQMKAILKYQAKNRDKINASARDRYRKRYQEDETFRNLQKERSRQTFKTRYKNDKVFREEHKAKKRLYYHNNKMRQAENVIE